MIDKPLIQITFADIDQFVQEKWPEGKTVDYKRDQYGNRDDDKKELLKDVSSFANTQGGDILIGVDEDKGVPSAIPGVTVPDIDKEKLRLEEIIRRGLDPRIEFAIHHVFTPASTTVIIIRVQESLLFPHRVVFQGKFGEFWARSSAGKYSMDTDELRRAFTLSATIYEQIKAFRSERVAQVTKGETPVPLMPGGKLILHLIPVASFRSRQLFDVATMPDLGTRFPPMGTSGWDYRLNLDGHVSYSGGRTKPVSRFYTQFFRNGAVEAVISDVVMEDKNKGKLLLAGYCERTLLENFPRLMAGFRQTGVLPPLWGFLTITGVKGAKIPSDSDFGDEYRDIDRDSLLLPEFVIDDLGADASSLLRPVFDLIWNASGFARSFNFDTQGKWVGR
jgi:Putative DNA-binding domain